MNIATPIAAIGDNLPPPDLLLGEPLRERLAEGNAALLRRRDELLAAEARLPAIEDEDAARKVSDYIKQITAAAKAADTARVGEKEPYLEGGRNIDGFFRAVADPLLSVKKRVEAKLTLYLREKEQRERREREERERIAAEAEAKARREAEEAERALRDEQTLADAIEARKRAEQAEADRVKAQKEAEAKPADLSRTRGEYGAVASLRTTWTFRDIDRATLDLEALRPHLPSDGLDRAVRSFVRAGGRTLRGVEIYECQDAAVR